jgi:glycosyltransferase involved in cell wall biosynthesis
MIYLSIVIPSYNSGKTILPLLTAISGSIGVDFKELEIIVVDDCSSDDTLSKIGFLISRKKRLENLKIIKLKENSGPAKARNTGVKYAKGKIILFFDADVIPHNDAIAEVINSFKNDPDLYALTGVWDKKQKTKKFFPEFKALRDWSYWINERDPKNYYYLFSTRVAAIDRGLFLRLGGFDSTYKAALVEDMELTYRIARRYAVIFNPKVMVQHEFEDFLPIAKKYFWRSYFWSKIYRERKKFDPVATTSKEALTTISAGGIAGMSGLFFISYLSNLSGLSNIFLILTSIFLLLHLMGVRKFLVFCVREKGLVFALKSFITGLILYLIILSGAAFSFLNLW